MEHFCSVPLWVSSRISGDSLVPHHFRLLAHAPDFDSQLCAGWWRDIPGEIVKRVLKERSVSAVGAVGEGEGGIDGGGGSNSESAAAAARDG